MNLTILIGRLTKTPELKRTNTDLATCQFTLAVDRAFKGQNGDKQTDFINCVAWRKTAEVLVQYCDKGHKVGIEGQIQTRNYSDSNGVKHYITEVLVNQLHFLESKKDGQATNQCQYNQPQANNPAYNQQYNQSQQFQQPFNQPYQQPFQNQINEQQQRMDNNPFNQDVGISSDDLPF